MNWKPVNVPELTYDMFVFYAKCHNITIQEAARRFLFDITLKFWVDPELFDCYMSIGENED